MQHAVGNLARPAASFSDQLPVISIGVSEVVLNGSFWSPFTSHWLLALTVAGQRRIHTGLPRLHAIRFSNFYIKNN